MTTEANNLTHCQCGAKLIDIPEAIDAWNRAGENRGPTPSALCCSAHPYTAGHVDPRETFEQNRKVAKHD